MINYTEFNQDYTKFNYNCTEFNDQLYGISKIYYTCVMNHYEDLTQEQKQVMLAIERGDIEALKMLVSKGCNVNFDTGRTISTSPLYYACFLGKKYIVEWLVENGQAKCDHDTVTYVSQVLGQLEIASFLAKKIVKVI